MQVWLTILLLTGALVTTTDASMRIMFILLNILAFMYWAGTAITKE